MIHEDIVNCENCGAEITHVVCSANVPTHNENPDYYLCNSCAEETGND